MLYINPQIQVTIANACDNEVVIASSCGAILSFPSQYGMGSKTEDGEERGWGWL